MQAWVALQFIGALIVLISCLAIIIGRLHIIERAEEQDFWKELKKKASQ